MKYNKAITVKFRFNDVFNGIPCWNFRNFKHGIAYFGWLFIFVNIEWWNKRRGDK